MPRLLTVSEAAERLQASERTIRQWLREGKLEGENLRGQIGWRIPEEAIEHFVERMLNRKKGN